MVLLLTVSLKFKIACRKWNNSCFPRVVYITVVAMDTRLYNLINGGKHTTKKTNMRRCDRPYYISQDRTNEQYIRHIMLAGNPVNWANENFP